MDWESVIGPQVSPVQQSCRALLLLSALQHDSAGTADIALCWDFVNSLGLLMRKQAGMRNSEGEQQQSDGHWVQAAVPVGLVLGR